MIPYGVIDGAYYILTGKSTDLGWKGPKDQQFCVALNGEGKEDATLHIKYNASGVDLELDANGKGSRTIPCQVISEVTVTSTNAKSDLTLEIFKAEDGDMKRIYESKPLKGKGQLLYKNGEPTAGK